MVYIIGITGGTASGKTSTCSIISRKLDNKVLILSMDSFYRSVPTCVDSNTVNFDHPDQFDWDLLYSVILRLKQNKTADIPYYNFKTHQQEGWVTILPEKCVIFEGILVLYDKRIRDLLDMKVFVDTPSDIRLVRRIRRDIIERGRTLESVLDQCEKTVIPSYDQFIEPTKRYADLIVPRGKTNITAIAVMVSQIRGQL